jgi:hypothetical protein
VASVKSVITLRLIAIRRRMTRIKRGRMPTRRRVIRIRPGRITIRPRVRAISEARVRISTLLTMISRPVATGLPMTGALWRVSDRVVTGAAVSAVRQQCRGAQGRDELTRLHDHQDDPDASREDILLRASAIRHGRLPIGPRQPTTGLGQPPTAKDAARERAEALRHRMESADDLRFATTDDLTGARTRRFGLEEVSRERRQAQRSADALQKRRGTSIDAHPARGGPARNVVRLPPGTARSARTSRLLYAWAGLFVSLFACLSFSAAVLGCVARYHDRCRLSPPNIYAGSS